MQVDIASSPNTDDGPFSYTHVAQAAQILNRKLGDVGQRYQDLTPAQKLLTAVSRYNGGRGLAYPNSDQKTTGNDYGNDVMARAQYYARVVNWDLPAEGVSWEPVEL
jgi:hypothetical protein